MIMQHDMVAIKHLGRVVWVHKTVYAKVQKLEVVTGDVYWPEASREDIVNDAELERCLQAHDDAPKWWREAMQ